jgi:hypothetical protein
VRTPVISDTHFGAWTGRDPWREEFFLERPAPALEGLDELEPDLGPGHAHARYLRHAWPGTAVLIDEEAPAPQLLEPLRDLNPLRGGPSRPAP